MRAFLLWLRCVAEFDRLISDAGPSWPMQIIDIATAVVASKAAPASWVRSLVERWPVDHSEYWDGV